MRTKLICLLLPCCLYVAAPMLRAAQDAESMYLKVFNIIQEADKMSAPGQEAAAREKYYQAQTNLLNLRRAFPDWNARMVTYRMNYLTDKLTVKAPEPAEGPQDSTKSGSPAQPAKASGPVKLLQPGAEPRVVLRLAPKEGDQQKATMTLKLGIGMKMGEMDNPGMNLPSITLPMDVTITGVSPEGDISYNLVMGEANIPDDASLAPEILGAMKPALESMKGASGSGIVSARGISKKSETKFPPNADPQARQMMSQIGDLFSLAGDALPEEPVGLGAKWQSRAPVNSQGMKVDQTSTYELVSLENERMVIRSSFSQSAANQKIENPAMPGLKVDVVKMVGKGKGERTQSLTQLLPASSTMDSTSEMTMGINMGDQKQAITLKMDVSVRLESK